MSGVVREGFLSLRDAIYVLAEDKFTGRPYSEAVKRVRRVKLDSRYDANEVQEVADDFWTQVDKKNVIIRAEHPRVGELVVVEPHLLNVPGLRRTSVSDLSYMRATNPLANELARRFGQPVKDVQLLVKTSELHSAAKDLRRTRKRMEARTALGPSRLGRPSKRKELSDAVIRIVESEEWRSKESLKVLRSLLWRKHHLDVSDRTVDRALDDLFTATDDRRYQRRRAARNRA